jgi:hypothetical protein
MYEMIRDGTWTLGTPRDTDLVEIFVSKTSWYEHYKLFAKVKDHPELEKWLEGGKDAPRNTEIWEEEKIKYSFKDLAKYLDLDSGKAKVKGKGKGKEKVKRKAAGSVSEGEKKKKKGKARASRDDDSM